MRHAAIAPINGKVPLTDRATATSATPPPPLFEDPVSSPPECRSVVVAAVAVAALVVSLESVESGTESVELFSEVAE